MTDGTLQQGDYVTYVENHLTHKAIVRLIFADHGVPYVTLAYVRSGARGEIITKSFIPHESRWTEEFVGYWRMNI